MEKFLSIITSTEISEVYNLLEEIMEALGDGRKPEESTAQFRDRKADELIKYFSDKKAKAEDEEKVAHKQAEHAKKEYHKNPNMETGQKMLDATFNASDKLFKTSDASRKEAKAKNIKNKIEWRKNMSEALEILEEIMSELSEATVFPKKTVEQANKKYLEADKEKNVARRLSKKANEKLRKKEKELRDKGVDPDTDIQPNVNYLGKGPGREYQQAVKTAQSLHNKAREAGRKETAAHHEQKKLRATGHKGVIMREFEPVATKKGDSHKFAHVLKTNEALEILEELLFELDLETKQNISPNKVKRLKKNKDGETVEVVSVADELFPADGDAKKQYDRKILDKINDMIGGTGTLEDLIQLVKRGIPSRKSVHEGLDEAIAILEDIHDSIRGSNKSAKEKSELSMKAMIAQGKELVGAAKREGKLATDIMVKRSPHNTKNANGERYTNARRERTSSNGNSNLKTQKSTISERKNIFGHEEGTGTLEDLIQLVKRGIPSRKSVHEGLDEAIDLLETVEKAIEKKYGMDKYDARDFAPNRANDLYGKVNSIKSKLKGKGQGTSHNETKNSRGTEKNEQEQYNKIMNRSAQVDNLVRQIPFKDAVKKSKDRHYRKVIKDSVRSIDKNESLNNSVHEGLFVKDGRRDITQDLGIAEPFKKAKDALVKKAEKAVISKITNEAFDLMEEIISELKDETVEKALDASSNKLRDQLYSFTGVNSKDVNKDRKLTQLADKRAERHGKKVVYDYNSDSHKHVENK